MEKVFEKKISTFDAFQLNVAVYCNGPINKNVLYCIRFLSEAAIIVHVIAEKEVVVPSELSPCILFYSDKHPFPYRNSVDLKINFDVCCTDQNANELILSSREFIKRNDLLSKVFSRLSND